MNVILQHWLSSVHTEISQLQKCPARQSCPAYQTSPLHIMPYKKAKLIQQPQQERSAAFSHTRATPPGFDGTVSPKGSTQTREQDLSHKGVQTTVFTHRSSTLSPGQNVDTVFIRNNRLLTHFRF